MAKRTPKQAKKGRTKGSGPKQKGGKAPWSSPIPRAMRGGHRT